MLVSTIGKYLSRLYVQVLIGIIAGILVGHFYPETGDQLKPLGDLFIKLIRMALAPIIFASVVVGIARMSDLHEAGRVGVKAILYFEVASTIALATRKFIPRTPSSVNARPPASVTVISATRTGAWSNTIPFPSIVGIESLSRKNPADFFEPPIPPTVITNCRSPAFALNFG